MARLAAGRVVKQATKEWIDEALSGRCDRDREGVGATDAQAAERAVVSGARTTDALPEPYEHGPYVCPGCHAIGGEKCLPGCIDNERREREEYERENYEASDDDDQ